MRFLVKQMRVEDNEDITLFDCVLPSNPSFPPLTCLQ